MTPARDIPALDLRHRCMLAVTIVENPAHAESLAEALQSGGVQAVELALRSDRAVDSLASLRRAAPKLLLGAGTVLSPAQADAAKAAGADFALAPGFDSATVRYCAEIGLPFIPGVATASEIQAAVALGCRLLKWFPAEALGGVRGLRALAAPFRHLGVKYLPLGGITLETAGAYLAEPDVAAIGGSWIAPAELIKRQAWAEVRERAAAAAALGRKSPPVSA